MSQMCLCTACHRVPSAALVSLDNLLLPSFHSLHAYYEHLFIATAATPFSNFFVPSCSAARCSRFGSKYSGQCAHFATGSCMWLMDMSGYLSSPSLSSNSLPVTIGCGQLCKWMGGQSVSLVAKSDMLSDYNRVLVSL